MRPANHLRIVRVAAIAALVATASLATPPEALAAAPYTGRIGRIDLRTGHADTSVYRHGIIIRDASASTICVVTPDTENMDQFLSLATAALLAGSTVTVERGGDSNGQYKCYQIMLRP